MKPGRGRGFGFVLLAHLACASPVRQEPFYPEKEQDDQVSTAGLRPRFARQVGVVDQMVLRPDEFGTPVVDPSRGLAYVGSRTGGLFGVELATGEVLWSYDEDSPVGSVPFLADGGATLLFGNDDGLLTALDLETRTPRWTFQTEGTIRNAPIAGEGVVYFVTSRDQVFAVEARTGAWRWQYTRDYTSDFSVHGRAGLTFVPGATAEQSGTLFTGFADGKAVSIDASTGDALWIADVAPSEGGTFVDCDTTPRLESRRKLVFVAGHETGVFALAAEDGAVKWKYPVKGVGSILEPRDGLVVATSSLEGVVAIDYDGRLRWRQKLDPGVITGTLQIGDVFVVAHADRGLYGFTARQGRAVFAFDTGSGVSGTPAYDPGSAILLALTNRGLLVAFDVIGDGAPVAVRGSVGRAVPG